MQLCEAIILQLETFLGVSAYAARFPAVMKSADESPKPAQPADDSHDNKKGFRKDKNEVEGSEMNQLTYCKL